MVRHVFILLLPLQSNKMRLISSSSPWYLVDGERGHPLGNMQSTWKDKCLNESLRDKKHLMQPANKRMSERSLQPIPPPLSLHLFIWCSSFFFSFILLFSNAAFDPPLRSSWPTSTYTTAVFFLFFPLHSHSFTLSFLHSVIAADWAYSALL